MPPFGMRIKLKTTGKGYVSSPFLLPEYRKYASNSLLAFRSCREKVGLSTAPKHAPLTNGGIQEKKYILEGDLYRLIIRSKLESAQRFERWVFDEVLPTIRKYGFYATDDMLEEFLNDPDLAIGVFSKLKEEREKVKQLESENKKLTEKSEYLDMLTKSPNAVPITVIAKDYDMSAQEMNGWLRCIGVQYKLRCGTWVLYQAYVGNGYTKSKTIVYDAENCKTRVHTCWTQKGRRFIYEKLKAYGVLPVCERGEDYENPSIPD